MRTPLEAVKAALQAYVDKDRRAIEEVIASEYRFSSPLDNAIDRATYFSRCWPNSQTMTSMRFVHGAEAGELAWIVYEGSTATKRFRNTELHRVRNGQIIETEVYFGWDLPHPAPAGAFISAQ